MNPDTNVLPPDFDGVFRFTNYSDEPFVGRWGGIDYTFPPQATSPMIIASATPAEVQHIRKKFAKELGTREYRKSDQYKALEAKAPAGSGFVASVYTDNEIAPFVQRCLEPLPVATAKATLAEKPAVRLRTDAKGKPVTKVLEEGESLVGEGAPMD